MDARFIIVPLIAICQISAYAQDGRNYIEISKDYEELIDIAIGTKSDTLEQVVFSTYDGPDGMYCTEERKVYYTMDISSSRLQHICIENKLYSTPDRCDRLVCSSRSNSKDCIIGTITSHLTFPDNATKDCYVYLFQNETIIIPRFQNTESYFCDRPVEMLTIFLRFAKKNNIEDRTICMQMLELMSRFSKDNILLLSESTYENNETETAPPALESFLTAHPIRDTSSDYMMECIMEFTGYARQVYSGMPKGIADMKILSEIVRMMDSATD